MFELVIILVLMLANGFFAMSEIAVVSAKKARLRKLADDGDASAMAALKMAENPHHFLATVQVGITLIGIFTGVFGGATLAGKLADAIRHLPWIAPYANPVAMGVVVAGITYLSLIVGELVPKRLGLAAPEAISRWIVRPMALLASLAKPFVWALNISTEAVLRLLGSKGAPESPVTEEEVKLLVQEGLRAGAFLKTESDMVESVLQLDQTPVREIMTPRPKMIWLNQDDTHEAIWHKIVVSNHSFFPVYERNRDRVVGIVSVKSVYANLAAGVAVRIKDLMVPPLVVPASQNVAALLDTFKQTGKHHALVADEFGGVVGLVTSHDVMEAIVGELPSQDARSRPEARRRDDGTWLVDAMIEIDRFEAIFPQAKLGKNSGREYQTLAGFIVQHLGRVPKEGEVFERDGLLFEILDMDHHRIDKVLIMPASESKGAPSQILPPASQP